jgi:hypothetical protein
MMALAGQVLRLMGCGAESVSPVYFYSAQMRA